MTCSRFLKHYTKVIIKGCICSKNIILYMNYTKAKVVFSPQVKLAHIKV